jgi:predicted 2-oxoglutarate/Fe(II)-dependent dioxygenase YbiX
MDLTKAIVQFNGLFSFKLIDRIVNYLNIENLTNLEIGRSTSLDQLVNTRNVKGFTCGYESLSKKVLNQDMTRYIFFKYIQKELSIHLLNYMTKVPFLEYENIIQSDFLKYEVNGKYEVHVDNSPVSPRTISIIVNLNDDYEGGDFVFFNPFSKEEIIHSVSLKKGSVLMFPSNFLYPHSVKPITKGTRYSIVSWAL